MILATLLHTLPPRGTRNPKEDKEADHTDVECLQCLGAPGSNCQFGCAAGPVTKKGTIVGTRKGKNSFLVFRSGSPNVKPILFVSSWENFSRPWVITYAFFFFLRICITFFSILPVIQLDW